MFVTIVTLRPCSVKQPLLEMRDFSMNLIIQIIYTCLTLRVGSISPSEPKGLFAIETLSLSLY